MSNSSNNYWTYDLMNPVQEMDEAIKIKLFGQVTNKSYKFQGILTLWYGCSKSWRLPLNNKNLNIV